MQVANLSMKIKCLVGLSCMSLLLSTCRPIADQTTEMVHALKQNAEDTTPGTKLIDVVNQAPLPPELGRQQQDQHQSKTSLRTQYAGRYHAKINCERTLVSCEKGEVEYVLNLLEDGGAYRTIIRQGKIYVDEGNGTQSYRQDSWEFDPQEDDLVIYLKEGAELFFDVDEQANLHLDVYKTLNYDQDNRDFFRSRLASGYESYMLTKIKEPKK